MENVIFCVVRSMPAEFQVYSTMSSLLTLNLLFSRRDFHLLSGLFQSRNNGTRKKALRTLSNTFIVDLKQLFAYRTRIDRF